MKTIFSVRTVSDTVYPVKKVMTLGHFTCYLIEIRKGKYQVWHEHGLNISGTIEGTIKTIQELINFSESAVLLQFKLSPDKLNAKFSDAQNKCPLIIV